jgi:hypothetical protein
LQWISRNASEGWLACQLVIEHGIWTSLFWVTEGCPARERYSCRQMVDSSITYMAFTGTLVCSWVLLVLKNSVPTSQRITSTCF